MRNILIITVLLCAMFAGSGAANAAPGPWSLTSSDDLAAYHTPDGVLTTASLDLQIGCDEAQIQPAGKIKFHYKLVKRKKNIDPGHVCSAAITRVRIAVFEFDQAGISKVYMTTANFADQSIQVIVANH